MAVSEKNTKKEILEEVEKLATQLKEARATKVTISQVQEQKVTETKKENAKTLIEKNILAPEIMAQYNDVMFAIEEAKKELAEIQGVEKAIIDAEAVIMAKEALLSKKESETLASIEATELLAQSKLDEIKEQCNKAIAEKEAKINELVNLFAEKEAELKKSRTRETEEYKYNLERERKLENDRWNDEKNSREREISLREIAVETRELTVYGQEIEFDALKSQVEEIPSLIAEAKATAFAEGEKAAGKTYGFEKAAIKKEAEFQAQLKDNEIATLKTSNSALEAKVAILEAKLEAAYTSMNDLAKTTVTSTGGVNVISTNSEKNK